MKVSSATKEADRSVDTTYNLTVYKVNENTPIFSSHPQDGAYFVDDTATALSVEATAQNTNGMSLSYQWYQSTENTNENGTEIEGANEATYTPPVEDMGGEDIYYYCVVTNTNGENKEQTASKPALIRVREVPKHCYNGKK